MDLFATSKKPMIMEDSIIQIAIYSIEIFMQSPSKSMATEFLIAFIFIDLILHFYLN